MVEELVDETVPVYERRWWAFSVLVLSILIVVIDHTILNVALPTLQRELGATVGELQWIVDAYILAFATLLLTMGTLGDRVGRAALLRLGMAAFGLASLFAVLAGSAGELVLARVAMGAGAAAIMPATLAIITNIFPTQERGKAIGIWGAMNGVGVALGPLLGGFLLNHFAWSAVFFINIPIVVTALVAGFFLIPDSKDPSPRSADLPGTVLSMMTLSLLVFALIKSSDWGWAHPAVLGSLLGGLTAGLCFVLRERCAAAPMLDLSLFGNRRLSAGVSGIALMTIAMFGVLFCLTMYLQFVKAYSPLRTGLMFLPLAFGYAFGSVSSNRNARRWGTAAVVTAGFLGMAVLSPVIATWGAGTPWWQIGVLLFAFSYGMGNIMTPSLNSVLGAVPKSRAGVGSALGNVSFQVGGALGVAALGSVLSAGYRSSMAAALSALGALPTEVSVAARDSVGCAVGLAAKLPAEGREALTAAACQSFMAGWQTVLLIACAIGVIGAVLSWRYIPRNEASQEGRRR